MIIKFYKNGDFITEFNPGTLIDGVYNIGREGTGKADIVIPEPIVSRKHASLQIKNGSYFVSDQNSKGGTFLNNKKISPNSFYKINRGDIIHFSSPAIQALVFGEQPAKNEQWRSLQDLLQTNNEIIIGRSPECDIVIDSSHVSRKHCQVFKKNGKTYLKDLASKNGTFVNSERIKNEVILSESDIILIGTAKFSLAGPYNDLRDEAAIKVSGLQKKFSDTKYGFHTISMTISSASITGIMGPSGCGKSTLLNTLTGNILPSSGSVEIHGLDLYQNYQFLKYYIGYVPQHDIVHKELTVYESLYYTAKIRLELDDNNAIDEKITSVLSSLDILELKENSISSLSGGQKKRVCIAIELINDPLILFLDEPTSPLDPQSALQLMQILQKLVKQGTTIVVVTHKPDDLRYLHKVMFLGRGGFPMFFGNASKNNILEYFNESEIVNIYSCLNEPDTTRFKEINDKYELLNNEAAGLNNIADPEKIQQKTFSPFNQTYWLIVRAMRIKLNDKTNTLILLLQAPVIAFLLCTVFKHLTLSVLFLLSLSAIWVGVNNAGREIVGEKEIYKRERLFNLGIGNYILSKLVLFLLLGLIQTVLFIVIVYVKYANEVPSVENPILLGLWLWVINTVSCTLGLVISSLSKTSEQVVSIIPLILIPQILLSGIMEKVNNMFVEVLSYLTLSRWGTEGFTNVQTIVHNATTSLPPAVVASMPADFSNPLKNANLELQKQYHNDYSNKNIFGSLTGTINLDILFLAIIFSILLFTLFWSLKKKDIIR